MLIRAPRQRGIYRFAFRGLMYQSAMDNISGVSNTIKRETLDDLPGEFPRFDERRAGLSYRLGWFAGKTKLVEDDAFNSIAQVDMRTGKRTIYDFPPGERLESRYLFPGRPKLRRAMGGSSRWFIAVQKPAATSSFSTPET